MARDDVVDSITSDAMSRTLTLLAMGHDSGRGVLTLGERSRVHLEWQGAHDEPSIRRTHELLLKITQAARGSLVKSPHLIVPFMNHDFTGLITVHPLGGCVMGESAESAVVNHKGQVFSGLTDNSVHDGLYICDGSVLPTSIGANPLLTIGAIAERTVDLMLQERTWSESSVSDVESSHHHQQMRQAGLRFSEQMLGHYTPSLETGKAFSTGVRQQQGANEGAASECRLFMTLSTNNLEQLLAQAPHALLVEGMFEVDGHRASPFDIEYGTFRIFTQDSERPDIRKMEYELDLRGADGKQYFFYGEKLLKDNAIFAVWSETTRMQFALHEGPDCSGSLVGGGLLQISASDFVQQLRSLTVTNVSDAFKRTEWTAKFGKFFAANLFQIYGHVRAGPTPLDEAHRSRVRRQLRSPDPQIHELNASDGTLLRLTRYRGGAKGPVIAAPGFGVTADSFAADTQQVNLVEYLTEFGYDVWLFDYRASPALAGSMEFSIDDIAQYDWPAAVRYVTQHCSCKSVQVIAHCVGSMTLLMAIADGMTQVRSAICSQLALHAHNWWITQLGAGFDVPTLLRRAGIQSLDINHHTQLLDLVDGALSIVPTPPGEACASPVCRRIFALFGPSYKHDNLNHATHEAVAEMFGVTSVAAFEQLARIVRHGHVVDKTGLNRYLRVGRLQRLALPVLFLAGADNQLFPPRCSEKTVELLGAVNGSQLYERSVIPGYAHMDLFIGKEAHRDVFPLLTDYLARS